MDLTRTLGLMLALALGPGAGASCQEMQTWPQLPLTLGEFKPVVGSGARYEVTTKDLGELDWTYAVVGKETVQGVEGYWLEMRLEGSGEGGMITKHLVVLPGGKPEIKRMIVQAPGGPPLELPVGALLESMQRAPQASAEKGSDLGAKLGTETVTVPGGSFLCDHYQVKHEKATTEIWISTKVSPYGLVKMTSPEVTIVLVEVLERETSHIEGEPQKMDNPSPGLEEKGEKNESDE
jgi:hypothetical protein